MIFTIICFVSAIIICQGSTLFRSDVVGDAKTSVEGAWGDWSTPIYCNDGHFATGFILKVESDQGGRRRLGDDTAANSFRMYCDDGNEVIADKEGGWGDWSDISDGTCPSESYIIGFRTKVEASQGGRRRLLGDDTALNSIQIRCSDNTPIEASNGGVWGEWGEWGQCDARQSVCGFRQKVESDQGGRRRMGDDTALNAIQLYCCQNKKVLSSPIGYWARIAGFGGGGSVSHTSKYGVTHHTESELSKEFAASVTATVELGMDFAIGSVTTSLSTTVSSSIASRMLESTTTTTETEITFECGEGDQAMYQWVTKMTEDAMTETFDFEIKSKDIWCVSDDSYVPQCAFGYCADDDCQICDDV